MAGRKRNAAGALKVKVDLGLKRRWEEAVARLRKARAAGTQNWDDLYEAVGDILDGDPPYYLAEGYASAREFLAAELPEKDERTVRKYVRVAGYFDPPDEERHGIEKLDEALNYLEATCGVPLAPAKIRADKIVARVPDGETIRKVPFDQATVQDLRAATRAAGSARTSPREPEIVTIVRKALSVGGVRSVAVRLRSGHLSLSGIQPARLVAVARALAKTKIPQGLL